MVAVGSQAAGAHEPCDGCRTVHSLSLIKNRALASQGREGARAWIERPHPAVRRVLRLRPRGDNLSLRLADSVPLALGKPQRHCLLNHPYRALLARVEG